MTMICMLCCCLLGAPSGEAVPQPAPKRILLLGDSISMGYTPFVQEALKNEAVVIRPKGNCEGTTTGIAEVAKWLALEGGQWDIIHFNFGLHDLKYVQGGKRQAEPEVYEKQLRAIVARLKQTKAKLIFATTTPVPDGGVKPRRDVADVPRYNAIARKIMQDEGVAVNDLYSFALPRLKELQRPVNVHFTQEGSRQLGGEVVRHLRLALTDTPAGAPGRGGPRYNVIVILVDDLGWRDLGCQGATIYETPHIDKLARQGMRFTQAYSACTVCSPTRAALLTGRYPARLHLTDWIPGHGQPRAKLKVPEWTQHLPLEESTLADTLGQAGYATACIGKWHLGGQAYYPEKQGFALNLGGTHRGQPPSYFSPYKIPTLPDGPTGEYLTDREAAEAVKFITAHKDRPFFLYLPHHTVHTPLMAKPHLIAKYKEKAARLGQKCNPTYAAMIESLDESVGLILKTLDELKLADRTLVVFTSDNGGLLSVTDNTPLRAGKGSAYEGGVRVPLLVKAPGVTTPGSECHTPVITMDLFSTVLALTSTTLSPKPVLDGENLVPLLSQAGGLRRTALFWHYPHYHPGGATPYGAIRAGDWRLIEFFEEGRLELYDLQQDPGERKNLAEQRPEMVAQLRDRLHAWRKEVGAQMPVPNPDYQPRP